MTLLPLRKSTVLFAVLALAACGKDNKQQQQQMPPPEVEVVKVQAKAVPLTRDLVGRLSATRTADVRARVPGVLQKRLYTEGTDVKEGQPLFEIDPAPLKATLNAQQANLASAQATYQNNHIAAERVRSIADKGLLSKTDRDNAEAAERTAAASVKQAQANLESAKINLGYATVTAPISGRAGQQQVTEGALVGQADATLLTTVEQIDPLYVNFSQAVSELDRLKSEAASGTAELSEPNKAKIELMRPEGSSYGVSGTLDFSDAAVDASTGAVNLRGIVPNPDHHLLPGTFVNVRVTVGELKHAYVVPQASIQRDAQNAFVFVLGNDGKVAQKNVTVHSTQGSDAVVTGLADGDQVLTSGLMKVRPGAPAKAAVPGSNPAAPGAAGKAPAQGANPQAPKSADQKPAEQKPDEQKH
jgi:membrane fusion protein (multidrug efflux system)